MGCTFGTWRREKSDRITLHKSPLEVGVSLDAESLLTGSWKEKSLQRRYTTRWARWEPSGGNSGSGGAALWKELREAVLTSLGEMALGENEGQVIKKSSSPSPSPFRLASLPQIPSDGGERRTKVYRYFLDELLSLKSNQRETLGVRRRGVELASAHPYREAAEFLDSR